MQSAKCRWSHSVIYIPEQKMLNVKHNDAPILAQNIMLLLLQVFGISSTSLPHPLPLRCHTIVAPMIDPNSLVICRCS